MTTFWYSRKIHMRHTRAIPPAPNTVEYTYRVWATVGATEPVATPHTWDPFTYALNVIDDANIPRPGMTISDWDATLAGTWADYFRFRTVSWAPVDSSMSAWDATLVATSKAVWCPEPNVFRSDSTQLRRVELYKDTTPSAASNAGTAISGTSVDEEGKPQFRDVYQVGVTIQFSWDSSDSTRGYPNLVAAAAYVNKRNSAAILGFPAGSLYFAGIDVDPDENETYRMVYRFVYDSWYHLEQKPALLPDQRPDLDANGNAQVTWFQPYSGTAQFQDLLGGYEITWLEDGWLAWDSPGVACTAESAAATAPTSTSKRQSLGGVTLWNAAE